MSLVLAMFAMAAMADSPLTSTVFHPCYADVAMVAQAAALKGQDMNPQVAAYLADNTQPVDQRAAVVNALGWNSDGTNNGKILLKTLFQQYGVTSEDALCQTIDGETLAIYAYTLAMSDYFNVEHAMQLGNLAVTKNRHLTQTVEILASLIRAQYYLDHNKIGRVGRTVREVLADDVLKADMRPKAIEAIMSYIDLY